MTETTLSTRDKRMALIRHAAIANHVSVHEVLAGSRHRQACRARWFAMVLIQLEFDYSYSRLARLFGLHHSTAMHGMASFFGQDCTYGRGRSRAGMGRTIETGLRHYSGYLQAAATRAYEYEIQTRPLRTARPATTGVNHVSR